MTYDRSKDPTGTANANGSGAARNWYNLQASQIGAKELPAYGRSLRVRMGSAASVPLTMVVVPIDEADDATTQTLIVDKTEYVPYGVRRIVSINGGTALPSGISIDVITK